MVSIGIQRAEAIAQLLRVLTALPEDLSRVPSVHIRSLTTTCNVISRGFDPPSPFLASKDTNTHICMDLKTINL